MGEHHLEIPRKVLAWVSIADAHTGKSLGCIIFDKHVHIVTGNIEADLLQDALTKDPFLKTIYETQARGVLFDPKKTGVKLVNAETGEDVPQDLGPTV